MSNTLALLFFSVSSTLSLPYGLLESICFVESNYKIAAVHYNDGNGHSLGICQIKYKTAKSVGYKGTESRLMKPAINIYWAGMYLSKQLKRYKGNHIKAIAAYNAGTHRVNSQGKTMNRKYVDKVFKTWVVMK